MPTYSYTTLSTYCGSAKLCGNAAAYGTITSYDYPTCNAPQPPATTAVPTEQESEAYFFNRIGRTDLVRR